MAEGGSQLYGLAFTLALIVILGSLAPLLIARLYVPPAPSLGPEPFDIKVVGARAYNGSLLVSIEVEGCRVNPGKGHVMVYDRFGSPEGEEVNFTCGLVNVSFPLRPVEILYRDVRVLVNVTFRAGDSYGYVVAQGETGVLADLSLRFTGASELKNGTFIVYVEYSSPLPVEVKLTGLQLVNWNSSAYVLNGCEVSGPPGVLPPAVNGTATALVEACSYTNSELWGKGYVYGAYAAGLLTLVSPIGNATERVGVNGSFVG